MDHDETSRFLLQLNDTQLIFLHPEDTGLPEPYVVQVTIKSDPSNRPPNVAALTTFFLAQHDITELIVRVINAHILSSFPPYVVFEDEKYSLAASEDISPRLC